MPCTAKHPFDSNPRGKRRACLLLFFCYFGQASFSIEQPLAVIRTATLDECAATAVGTPGGSRKVMKKRSTSHIAIGVRSA